MSLRIKIILLFLGLAVVPLMILASFSYWQAGNLLRNMVQGQLQETASAVGGGLDQASADVSSMMESLSDSILGKSSWDPEQAGSGSTTEEASSLPGSAYIHYTTPSGHETTIAGSVPNESFRCDAAGGSRIIEFSMPVSERGLEGTLTAGFWAADLIPQEGRGFDHSVLVLDAAEERILYSDQCQVMGAANPAESILSMGFERLDGQGSGLFKFREAGEERLGALVRLTDSPWTVVASSSPAEVFAPVNRLVWTYWLFVLGMALATVLAFSMLIGQFTKSLGELARAAEEIGTGELDPWLPVPTSGEIGQLTLAFSRMLARIRQMMTKVDQSGRLAVVGQLSAYLAHEIRNPLSSIKLNLQRLMRWTKNGSLPEFCFEPLEISLREVERLSASVSGVLELSRAQDGPKETVSLHHLVEEASDLLSARFRRQGVELVLDLDADADRALARAGQVKSVILNLMVNALEAQPSGGRLEIRSELSQAPELRLPVVALHFKDDGTGVPPDVRDRIFEPFFTTKPGGSGIGLAMAAQAVRDNGGDLYLEPAPLKDSGAEFVVVFPLPAISSTVAPTPKDRVPSVSRAPRRWSPPKPATDERVPGRPKVPAHLMTPEGLEAVLALTLADPEEVN